MKYAGKRMRGRMTGGSMPTESDINEILVKEYLRLQETVETFDGKALTIKAWSVTLSAAAIVAAYVEKAPVVLLVASGSALIFWLVEALWKVNQQAFYQRIYEIEDHFGESGKPTSPLRIAGAWSAAWRERGRDRFVFKVMWWSHVMLPHAAVAVLGALLFIFARPMAS
jgi:hypothetical protein